MSWVPTGKYPKIGAVSAAGGGDLHSSLQAWLGLFVLVSHGVGRKDVGPQASLAASSWKHILAFFPEFGVFEGKSSPLQAPDEQRGSGPQHQLWAGSGSQLAWRALPSPS